MAFIVDDGRRVHDPERDLTLTLEFAEKEGHHQFALTGAGLRFGFIGRREVTRIAGADPSLPAPLRTRVTWRLAVRGAPSDWTREETERTVAEAMSCWKFAHGGPAEQLVEVRFT